MRRIFFKNKQSLEAVDRGIETQLQVTDNLDLWVKSLKK